MENDITSQNAPRVTLQIPNGVIPTRTQHYLSRKEMIQGMANRFMYSEFYIYLYASLGLLSVVTLVLSAVDECPGFVFYLFEIVVNVAMIAEVTIRFLALRRAFWQSIYNIVDIVLVVLCGITLIFVFMGCSAGRKEEEVFETVLLILRNGIQFGRIAFMLRRNGKNIFGHLRSGNLINFDNLRAPSFSIDIDLEAEHDFLDGSLGVRNGGRKVTLADGRRTQSEQAFLLGNDEEEEENENINEESDQEIRQV